MPQKHAWNARSDASLARLRKRGFTWETIGFAFGLSRSAVIRRGMLIGLRQPPASRPDPELTNPGRDPLRAGHPLSWGILTAGTLLENAPYTEPRTLAEEPPLPRPAGSSAGASLRAQKGTRTAPTVPPPLRARAGGGMAGGLHAPSA